MVRCALIAAVCTAVFPASAASALPRSTMDRPDEQRGPQIHVIYALPSDGVDRRLDETGQLEGSVASFQAWLAGETGGPNLRMDTYQGSLDVGFVRLAQDDATIASRGAFVRDAVQDGIRAAGFDQPERIYAVYYDGSSTYACGGAFWPPALQGSAVVMYLRGRPPGADCSLNGFAAAGSPPTYWEYAMLHDLLHGLGLVASCAPNHHLSGHVSDFPDDLMWSGSQPWRFPARLDIGRNDYYGHGRTDCADLARSPYLTSNPPPDPPPPPEPLLTVTSVAVTAVARAGRTVDAVLRVTLDGAVPPSGAARCTAKVAGRVLKPVSSSFSGGAARCRWRLPAGTKGKRLTATVRASTGSLAVSRSFVRIVR
jgi:hypothetical protein